jgi:hypothetical protein
MLKIFGNEYFCGTIPTAEQMAKLQYFLDNHLIMEPNNISVIESWKATKIDAQAKDIEKQVSALRDPGNFKKKEKEYLGGHLKNVFDGKR